MSTHMRACDNCDEPTHEQILCDFCGVECCQSCVPELRAADDKDWCGNCEEETDAVDAKQEPAD